MNKHIVIGFSVLALLGLSACDPASDMSNEVLKQIVSEGFREVGMDFASNVEVKDSGEPRKDPNNPVAGTLWMSEPISDVPLFLKPFFKGKDRVFYRFVDEGNLAIYMGRANNPDIGSGLKIVQYSYVGNEISFTVTAYGVTGEDTVRIEGDKLYRPNGDIYTKVTT